MNNQIVPNYKCIVCGGVMEVEPEHYSKGKAVPLEEQLKRFGDITIACQAVNQDSYDLRVAGEREQLNHYRKSLKTITKLGGE